MQKLFCVIKGITKHSRLAWIAALVLSIAMALLAGSVSYQYEFNLRFERLRDLSAQHSSELISLTRKGELMGAVATLGLIDKAVENEGHGIGQINSPKILELFSTLVQVFDAESIAIVSKDGIVGSSWNRENRPSTGLNVSSRPYFQAAMQGLENVYAGLDLTYGKHSLYFSAPIFWENQKASARTGAIVARTSLKAVDEFLQNKTDIALLVSPQGLVFTSNPHEWTGFFVKQPSPDELIKLRHSRQFGYLVDSASLLTLPFSVSAGMQKVAGENYAVTQTPIVWNDPAGDWQLVLMEKISNRALANKVMAAAALAAAISLVISMLLFYLLRSYLERKQVLEELRNHAEAQEINAIRKEKLTQFSMSLQRIEEEKTLAEAFLSEAHRMGDFLQGTTYLVPFDAPNTLRCVAHFACNPPPQELFQFGEGLIGQCAIEQRVQVITAENLQHFGKISSGLGNLCPRYVVLYPILSNAEFLGVVEIGFLSVPSEAAAANLNEMITVFATNLDILQKRQAAKGRVGNKLT